jgi:UDP:flavonoid glycosyltransferase YjiC (YdhE family)
VADALPALRDAVPNLRLVLVGGPRVETDLLRTHDGVEVLDYVHELYRHLAACDVAVSHGGLATTMELTALRRPFLYFPLRDHFEQNVHVRHRLERHGAGRYMDFDATGPAELAAAVAEELERDLDYAPVPVDGAARAARLVAELLEQPPVFRRTPPGSTRPWSLPTPVPSSSPSPAR